MTKLEKDGKVAILYSPGYGAGWSSWNSDHSPAIIFDPEIVEAILTDDKAKAESIAQAKYQGAYLGGLRDLEVEWITKGDRFEIHEYDGSESIRVFTDSDGFVA